MSDFFRSLVEYIMLAAPYLVLGFIFAGIIHQFLTVAQLQRWLGDKSWTSIFKASAIGVPLPLCSCGVIPAAVTLKKSGASNGAISAFMISTPETGIDSIVLTYGIMDLPMTIIRPISAFITATVAGLLNHFFNRDGGELFKPMKPQAEGKKNCCHTELAVPQHDHHGHVHQEVHQEKEPLPIEKLQKTALAKVGQSIRGVAHFALVELIDDLLWWLLLGLMLGAVISHFLPMDFFAQFNPHTSRFVVMLVGIPMYICASASTPIAASLVLKGMSPGTALIFLLTGPATNVANLVVLKKSIGTKGIMLNLVAIALCSYVLSYVVDAFYAKVGGPNFVLNEMQNMEHMEHMGSLHYLACIVFLLIILGSMIRKFKTLSFFKSKAAL